MRNNDVPNMANYSLPKGLGKDAELELASIEVGKVDPYKRHKMSVTEQFQNQQLNWELNEVQDKFMRQKIEQDIEFNFLQKAVKKVAQAEMKDNHNGY